MLPSETMIWQPEFTDKTLSRKTGAVQIDDCWEGWVISLRQKQKKLIMLPSETMIWQPEFTDKT
ncbi:hypothetical protein ACM2TY_24615, partial [Escherichia coli]